MLTIVNEGSSLTIGNEGLSLTIVNETTNFIKTVVFGKNNHFWKKIHTTLLNVVLHMKLKSCVGAKTSWYFLQNYLMIRTDAFQVHFLSSLTIVNEGLSLTIVNETTNFIKTVVFGKKIHATLLNVVLHEVKKCGGAKTFWYFLKNYSMISTGPFPLFVNDH